MDLMAQIFAAGGTPAPTDDFWYQPVGTMTDAGVRIDAEQAKKISAWYRGRDILATVLAMLPMQVMERLPNDGGSQPARDYPLYDVLHGEPNGWQDSFAWRRMKMYHLIDHGMAFDFIRSGDRGYVESLEPIYPSRESAPPSARWVMAGPPFLSDSGTLLFKVRDARTSQVTVHVQSEIFYLMGASDDGVVGKGILEYARGSLGTASATESYAATVYSRGSLNSGVIETPGVLQGDAGKRMAQSFITASKDWHLPKVLEQGAKWNESKLTPEDQQMLLSREFSVDDMARWLGVPRLMLENSDPSYGNAEQFTQNFVDINMGGWFALWEFACNRQLVVDPARYFVRINRKAIVRANWRDLVDGTVALVNAGIESVDEARANALDMPKRGGRANELREPQNITGKPTVPAA